MDAPVAATQASKSLPCGSVGQAATKEIKIGPGILDLGGSLRLRYEFLDNFSIQGYGAGERDSMLLERLRLNAAYRVGKSLSLFIQLQDDHFWFSRPDDVP